MYKFCLHVFVWIVLLMVESSVRLKQQHLPSSKTGVCLCISIYLYSAHDLLSGTLLGIENLFNLGEDILLVYLFLVCVSF